MPTPTLGKVPTRVLVTTTPLARLASVRLVLLGLVIPELLGSLDESLRGASAKKASVWVLDFHKGSLVAADYIESPLPVK